MPQQITLKGIREFFGMSTGDFSREWRVLDETAKNQIREGLSNGTLAY